MNDTFWIKSVGASGEGKEYSAVSFDKNKVNIIYGPSNTGKSYVIDCIDFMLFADSIPFTKENTGYDTIHMELETSTGVLLSLRRKIVDGPTGEKGDSRIEITATSNEIRSGEYTEKDYNALMLQLMGISEAHRLIARKNYKTESLTLRSLCPMFLLGENLIFTDKAVVNNPKYLKPYAAMSSIYFLRTGDDLSSTIPKLSEKELEKKRTERKAILSYIFDKQAALIKRKIALEEALKQENDQDIDKKIDATVAQIAAVEEAIRSYSAKSAELLEQIYDASAKKEEATFLSDRYKKLRSQYNSDLKRLRFIVEGEQSSQERARILACPFCGNEMKREGALAISYAAVAEGEFANVSEQLADLKQAEKDVHAQIEDLECRITQLNDENEEIAQRISETLQPQARRLREALEDYKRIVEIKKSLDAIEQMSSSLEDDEIEREMEEDTKPQQYNPEPYLKEAGWSEWSDLFGEMVRACAYPGEPEARISIETHDAIVGRKYKKDEGKGYRAFLNVLVLFSLMKWLETDGVYRPGIMVLDSPILSLKEKKENSEIAEGDQVDAGMKESLFQYLMDHCGSNQIIIAENEIPKTANMDYSKAHLISFGEEGGRAGFLRNPN